MNPRLLKFVPVFGVICALAAACSSDAPTFDADGGADAGCEPGATQPCVCTDTGISGVQTCDVNGAWTECQCSDPDPCGDGVVWVIDRSGSMADPASKWNDFMDALQIIMDDNEADVPMGLVMYPDNTCDPADTQNVDNLCMYPDSVDIHVGSGTGQSVWDALDHVETCGGTPTAGALEIALLEVQDSAAELQIILITDGLPNCNLDLNADTCECIQLDCTDKPYQCLDSEDTVAAAVALYQIGAPVHVFAYDVETNLMDVMDDVAEAGGSGHAEYCADATDLEISLAQFFQTIVDC